MQNARGKKKVEVMIDMVWQKEVETGMALLEKEEYKNQTYIEINSTIDYYYYFSLLIITNIQNIN